MKDHKPKNPLDAVGGRKWFPIASSRGHQSIAHGLQFVELGLDFKLLALRGVRK